MGSPWVTGPAAAPQLTPDSSASLISTEYPRDKVFSLLYKIQSFAKNQKCGFVVPLFGITVQGIHQHSFWILQHLGREFLEASTTWWISLWYVMQDLKYLTSPLKIILKEHFEVKHNQRCLAQLDAWCEVFSSCWMIFEENSLAIELSGNTNPNISPHPSQDLQLSLSQDADIT
ncbi:hypothetical protein Hamer_G002965 [Homarus americanus]|uniref:Uncharacterized protein n=1 Tax=Homarus americanus TaxID=6706 RepID=A0A8J5MTH3_HOMAM|nr:hypothetical protein Hamer_G002965 [Homarus americanus]